MSCQVVCADLERCYLLPSTPIFRRVALECSKGIRTLGQYTAAYQSFSKSTCTRLTEWDRIPQKRSQFEKSFLERHVQMGVKPFEISSQTQGKRGLGGGKTELSRYILRFEVKIEVV